MAKKKKASPKKKTAKRATARARSAPVGATRWARSVRPAEALDAPVPLDAEWYRILPIGVREIADGLVLGLRDGLPSAERPSIDRRRVPPFALIDVGHPSALLGSRGLVEALRGAGLRALTLADAPHLTGRAVAGYACAWLEVAGAGGRIESRVAAIPGAVRDATRLGGMPLAPVTLDRSSGHELAWTGEWLGAGTGAFRALIASRRLVEALFAGLAAAGDELWFGIEPVGVRSAAPIADEAGELPAFPSQRRARSPALAAIVAGLAERATRDGHELGGRSRADVGAWPDPDLRTLLSEHEGLRLHRGALELFGSRGRPSLAQATEAARAQGAAPREGERVFAVSPGLEVFWAITPEGAVRGLARSGLRYGPGAPVADWLADLTADLDAAVAQPERPWALSLLGR